MQVGKAQSSVIPQPGWGSYGYPSQQLIVSPPARVADYANEVEVERGSHDAVVKLFRRKGASRSLVFECTVPLALLDEFAPKRQKAKS